MLATTSIVFSTSAIVMPVVAAAENDAKLLEAGLDVLNNKVVAASVITLTSVMLPVQMAEIVFVPSLAVIV